MLPKHANGKLSRENLLWEICMKLGKKFFRGRPQMTRDPRCVAAEAGAAPARQSRSLRSIGTARQAELGESLDQRAGVESPQLRSTSETPRRTIMTAAVGLMLRGMERCGQCADLMLANFPAGILSWIFAQFFVGCAAYAEAMYPSIAFHDHEDGDRRELLRDGPADHGNSGRSPSLAPDLSELPRFEVEGGEQRSPLAVAGRNKSGAARSLAAKSFAAKSFAAKSLAANSFAANSSGAANVVRLDVVRGNPAGRSSIATLVAAWLSRRRRLGGEGQTIIELRNHDRRALRGMRLSRYGTE
jgi:hypothetical protein